MKGLCYCIIIITILALVAVQVTTTTTIGVKNFRAALPQHNDLIYRSAALEEISVNDAEAILNLLGKSGRIIDLRNDGEAKKMSDGGMLLFDTIAAENISRKPLIYSQRFWKRIEDEIPLLQKMQGLLSPSNQWQRTLAEKLEVQGLGLLYSIILDTAAIELGDVLEEIITTAHQGSPVIFHCAKGKDRTGVVTMLMQMMLGWEEDTIIKEYSVSEVLLEEPAGSGPRGTGPIDWRKLRGTPPSAMRATLDHLLRRGGIETYLSQRCQLHSSLQLSDKLKLLAK